MATKGFNALALGYAGAAVSAAGMLLLSIGAKLGLYTRAAERMMDWHMFYSLSAGGIIAGMIEAAVWSFVFLYALAWVYDRYA